MPEENEQPIGSVSPVIDEAAELRRKKKAQVDSYPPNVKEFTGIYITDDVLSEAEKGNPTKCVLALAIKKKYPNIQNVVVSISQRLIWLDECPFTLGETVIEALKEFDEKGTLPFREFARGGCGTDPLPAMGAPANISR